jgi:flagellar biosynthesis chaperone FliJ
MKKFVWRLQRVLDIRLKQESLKKTELLQIAEKLFLIRTELLGQERILANLLAEIAAKDPKSRIKEQEFFLNRSAVNKEIIKKLKEAISRLELEQRKKIEEIMEVRKAREALEKLRARAELEYKKEQEKLEQKEIDESATLSFVRRLREPQALKT